jgi:hypothetical protein
MPGASAHAAFEKRFEFLAHFEGIDPIVCRAGVILGKRADVRGIFSIHFKRFLLLVSGCECD